MLYLFRPFRAQGSGSLLGAPNALGIAAASFWSAAEKDIAESPARSERPKKKQTTDNCQQAFTR